MIVSKYTFVSYFLTMIWITCNKIKLNRSSSNVEPFPHHHIKLVLGWFSRPRRLIILLCEIKGYCYCCHEWSRWPWGPLTVTGIYSANVLTTYTIIYFENLILCIEWLIFFVLYKAADTKTQPKWILLTLGLLYTSS